jgi:hypothetical protein
VPFHDSPSSSRAHGARSIPLLSLRPCLHLCHLLGASLHTLDRAVCHNHCYGRLAVVSDVDDGGFALNVDKELRGSAVL